MTVDTYKSYIKPPEGIDCKQYIPLPGQKRCQYYLDSGICDRPDKLVCSEWMKLNGNLTIPEMPHLKVASFRELLARAPVDMFGNPLPGAKKDPNITRVKPREQNPKSSLAPVTAQELDKIEQQLEATDRKPPSRKYRHPLGLTDDVIQDFKQQRFLIGLSSEQLGSFWIVPELTGADRIEVTVDQVVTLASILQIFPNSKISAINKPSKPKQEDEKGDIQ